MIGIKDYVKGTFIGKDGSMGLKHGMTYRIHIESVNGYIRVTWNDMLGNEHLCPYTSVQTFKENWG